jgi:1,2-diacylglycerol-3-alpha-glucose alpha-1,2-galactosyltransferase
MRFNPLIKNLSICIKNTGVISIYSVNTAFIVFGIVLISLILIWKVSSNRARRKFNSERNQYLRTKNIRLNVISETVWVTRGQGVHTAFLDSIDLLSGTPNLSLSVNGDGPGNIFHSHTYGLYYFWRGRNYKGRRILTAHVIPDSSKGALPFSKFLMPLTTWYLKKVYSYADVIIAISPTVEQTIRDLGVTSRIVRINNPVLTDKWQRTPENRRKGREKLNIRDDEQLVIGVGQLQQRKGVEDFIDVAAAISNARFAWIGGRPWGAFTEGINRINKRIDNAPGNICFTGLLEIKEMAEMYAAADLFLFPSYQENCPLAPLEAAAAGLPVIFRDIKEYTKLYSHPYLKAKNTAGFVKMAESLLNNQEYRISATEISCKLLQEFDRDNIKQQLLELYHRTLERHFNLQVAEIVVPSYD